MGMDVAHCYLEGNTDAVEFCPYEPNHNVLAAATYTLQEGDQPTRKGSISLFNVDAQLGSLELFHCVQTSGIFDIKWSPPVGGGSGLMLAQADADGQLKIHRLVHWSEDAKEGSLGEIAGERLSSSMCLCLDWNPSATSITVGLSDGSVSVVSFEESQVEVIQEWKAHNFELWTSSFDIQQPQLLYTGSDDCNFSCWDLREDPSKSVFQNSRVHTMGVCHIAKSPSDPYKLFTGSYDEHLRIWDTRFITKPLNEISINLGGGVWRIKHHPFVPGLVLAACMHNGFCIVKTAGDEAKIIETYSKHGSLAYGADWHKGKLLDEGNKKSTAVATCSFYDKLLRVWKPESDILV